MTLRAVTYVAGFILLFPAIAFAGDFSHPEVQGNDSTTQIDTVPKGKNLIHVNAVSLMFREAELHYERLFFENKIGVKPYASYFLHQHEDVRGRRSRNYSGGLAAHAYLFENHWVRFLVGAGLEVGYYTNEQIILEPTASVPFDLSKRNERYTYYYGRIGVLIEPFQRFNLGLNFNLGSRQNRRLTNRDTFVHPAAELNGIFRF